MRSRRNSSFLALVVFLAAACAGAAFAQPATGRPDPPPPLTAAPELQGVKAARDIVYARPDGQPQLLDLYVPDQADGPLPLIIWIHGGGWSGGDKENPPSLRMAPRGYAAASINYRLTGVAKWPAQIYDCKAAVRWLRAHAKDYNLDPDHFGVWGESAGGHLVAMLGTSGGVKELEGDLGNPGVSSRVQAVCDWYGPTDLPVLDQEKSAIAWDKPDSFTSKLLGGPIREHLDAARQASPVTWVTKDAPPFLIMHGDKDPLVPFQQGEILDEALRKAGDQSRFILVPRAGHNLHNPESLKTVCDFFDEHLKKEN